jgi:hypothetical protein
VIPKLGKSSRIFAGHIVSQKFHPVSEILPLLEGDEFAALVASIKSHGLMNPIWLHPDGSIVDGRNRYRACQEARIEPRYQNWNGKGSLIDFVVAQNIERRHLDASQRALLAATLEPMYAEEAAQAQQEAGVNRGTMARKADGERRKPLPGKVPVKGFRSATSVKQQPRRRKLLGAILSTLRR